ncbi:MAG: uracil-DNA glycosylase family protein [Limnohabitans sp.]
MTDPTRDPTRFDLDERQRAMLAEMGIRVWSSQAPDPAADNPPTARAEAVAPVHPQVGQAQPAPGQVAQGRSAPLRPTVAVATPQPAALPADAVHLPAGVGQMDWDALQATVAQCRACGLCQTRRNTVFGVGDRGAKWMVIGEAPGENEDLQGEPFVGQAGKLLDNMLAAVGLNRSVQGTQDGQTGVYIANTLKCRPPGNRNPESVELQTCAPYLVRQVALVQPRIILAMGRFAVQSLLQTSEPIGRLRGRVHHYQGVPVVVTYHPAYLLRNPADKAKAWVDLCLALQTVHN